MEKTVYDGNLEQLMIENVDIVFFFSFWKVYTLTYVVVEEKEKHKKKLLKFPLNVCRLQLILFCSGNVWSMLTVNRSQLDLNILLRNFLA